MVTIEMQQGIAEVRTFLEDAFSEFSERRFNIRLWDGSSIKWCEEPEFVLVLGSPRGLSDLFGAPDLKVLGEAYVDKRIDIEGNVIAAIRAAYELIERSASIGRRLKLAESLASAVRQGEGALAALRLLRRGFRSARSRVKRSVNAHYDLPLEFWKCWLDPELQYTCAYFGSPEESLEAAQARKIDHICRKLRLRPKERFLELGCGWGGIMLRAARHYGVEAVGVTLSEQQAEFVRSRADEMGIADRCRVEVGDFRDFASDIPFDKAAGVGIIEHLGTTLHKEYFSAVYRLIRPGGLFLNQGITCQAHVPKKGGGEFLDEYVFPDHEIVPIQYTLAVAGNQGFELRDVENLREHYEQTLTAWLHGLDRRADRITRLTSEALYRAYRLYLAGVANDFGRGGLCLYQSLFERPNGGRSSLPLTRAHLYQDRG